MADYIYIMESRLTPEQQKGVKLVQDVARMHEMNIHLVGGVVRDIIGGAPIRDLDFAVQGNALKLVSTSLLNAILIGSTWPKLVTMPSFSRRYLEGRPTEYLNCIVAPNEPIRQQ